MLAGMGALCLAASVKLMVVDRGFDVAGYPAIGGVVFLAVAGLLWRRSGTFRITKTAIEARRRTGPPFQVLMSDIREIDTGTNKLPCLAITYKDGKHHLGGISARRKSIASLRSLGVQLR